MKKNVRQMVTVSLLTALIVVLQLLGYVLPRVGPFGLSFVLIPIVVGAAVYGEKVGAFLGGVFGIIVCICCNNGLDGGGFMVWQASPIMCIVVVMAKGILAGYFAGLVYRLLAKKNRHVAMLCAAALCPIVNTGLFLVGMRLFFVDVLNVWANGSNLVAYLLTGIVLVNFVPELIINLVFSPAGQRIVDVVKSK